MLKIASWNINSVRLRLTALEEILQESDFDVICLQETKVIDSLFPEEAVKKMGYSYIVYAGQKSYNGVCIISKIPFVSEQKRSMVSKDDKRHVMVEFENGLKLHNFYIPAGGDVPDIKENPKFAHKLDFVDEIADMFSKPQNKTIIVGDFNIAPYENDVWSHKQLLRVVSHTPIEVEKLMNVKAKGDWLDSHRHFVESAEKLYSWWSYRSKDWRKSNKGRRLDHIWLSPDLENSLVSANIQKESRGIERPSDHAVIDVTLKY